jgi:outer membrane protein assembly factor BamE (lipoprotein component of BamABCDE complex)
MKTFALAAAFATLALAGCTSGTFVSKEQSAQFQVGTTTEQQVLAQLGQPDAKAELINGGHRDSYVRVVDGETPIDYVPLVALAAAPRYGHTTTVNFDFDANGVLKDVSRFRERS